MGRAELVQAGALERHQPRHQGDGRRQRGSRRGGRGGRRGVGGGRRDYGGCRGRGSRDHGSPAAARGGEQRERGDQRDGAHDTRKRHGWLGSAKAPRCGPENSVVTSSRNARVSRVSSGRTIASTKPRAPANRASDRKSTRLNSSHGYISYAVFCLKKKTKTTSNTSH